MAITIRDQQTSVTSSVQTVHSVALPTFTAGDRLVLLANIDGTGTPIVDGLRGWTQTFEGARVKAYELVATGAESTLSITSDSPKQACFIVYAIAGAHASTPVEASYSNQTGIATYSFNPLTISGWSDEETLWLSGVAIDRASAITLPSAGYSAGFSELTPYFESAASSFAVGMAAQYRIATSNTESPTAWTGSVALPATTFVLAIRSDSTTTPVVVTRSRSTLNVGLN